VALAFLLQAVTKYRLEAAGAEEQVNIRDAFVAPRGHVLLSADYSQVGLQGVGVPTLAQTLASSFRLGGTSPDTDPLSMPGHRAMRPCCFWWPGKHCTQPMCVCLAAVDALVPRAFLNSLY
jgi:hypothetical protein